MDAVFERCVGAVRGFAVGVAGMHSDGEAWKVCMLSKVWGVALKLGAKEGAYFAKFQLVGGMRRLEMRERGGNKAVVSALGVRCGGGIQEALKALTRKLTQECRMEDTKDARRQRVSVIDVLATTGRGGWVLMYKGARERDVVAHVDICGLKGARWI